jgi:adenosylhomocysteine nucleosidase
MDVVVLISADIEWEAVRKVFPEVSIANTPYGESFRHDFILQNTVCEALFMHGGWGKIAAGASTQYAIDQWHPKLLVNLGTCGGFAGEIERDEIVLVDRTLIYDIYEQMGDPDSHLDHYATDIDLTWLDQPYPNPVRQGLMISADRDLDPAEINQLQQKYSACAGDWESGAIAFVAKKNGVPVLILRGVSDLVSSQGGEAYGDEKVFNQSAHRILVRLLEMVPDWLAASKFFR